MIVDTSALLAIVFQAPGFEDLLRRLEEAPVVAAGAPTLAETGILLYGRLGAASDGLLERLVEELGIQEIPFGGTHWREAVDAYRRLGRGRHAAALDLGDCMTYAVARLVGEPVLYVEQD